MMQIIDKLFMYIEIVINNLCLEYRVKGLASS